MSAELKATAELAAALRQRLAQPGSVPDERFAELGRRLVDELADRAARPKETPLARILRPRAAPGDLLHRPGLARTR